MIKVIVYYLMSVFFAVLTALCYQAFQVIAMGKYDPKFGYAGTIYFFGYITGICAAVCFLSSSFWFWRRAKKRNNFQYGIEFFLQLMINGLVIGLTGFELLYNLPVLNQFRDWPQYIIYFLVIGVLISIVSDSISRLIGRAE